MKAGEFRRLTAELEKLTPRQKQVLTDRLRATGRAQAVHELIESRGGATPTCPHCGKEYIGAVLKPILAADAILCTEGGKALGAVAREMGIVHRPVNLAQGVRVIAGVYHVQNVQLRQPAQEEWMHRFHGVATRYLANYLGWRRLIERSHHAPQPRTILLAALGINHGQQLTVT